MTIIVRSMYNFVNCLQFNIGYEKVGSWIIEQLIQAYHQYSVFSPVFVNYKKGCTRLATASDKVYRLLAHGRWFSLGTPASSTTKTGRHDIAEILLKVALNTKNQINFSGHRKFHMN